MFEQQMGERRHEMHDALDAPGEDGRRRGPTSRHTFERSAYTRVAQSPIGRALPFVAAAALVTAAIRQMRRAG
jgi:hypothetical protein